MMSAEQIAQKKMKKQRLGKTAEEIARAKIARRTTNELIEYFILTNLLDDLNIPTVRGWIMDELEKRNPDVFEAWLSQDDPDDRQLARFYQFSLRGKDDKWMLWHGMEWARTYNSRDEAIADIVCLAAH